MSREVSVQSGVLDLYMPKFGLEMLGIPKERIMLRVVVASSDLKKQLVLFGTYVVDSRHAQIATRELVSLGSTVIIKSIGRYSLKNFVSDVNEWLVSNRMEGEPRITSEEKGVFFCISGKTIPAQVKSMYASGAKVYAIVECCGKIVQIALGSDGVELFDFQRRKLAGMAFDGTDLTLLRAFQHPAALAVWRDKTAGT